MSRTGSALVPPSISTNSPADTLVLATVIAASRLPIRTRMDMLPPSPTVYRPARNTNRRSASRRGGIPRDRRAGRPRPLAPAPSDLDASQRHPRARCQSAGTECTILPQGMRATWLRDRILLCISGRHSRSFLKPSDARARAARRERRRLFVDTFCQLHDSLIIHADSAVCSTTSTAAAIDNCAHRAIVRLPANAQSVRRSSRSITQARISVDAILPSDPSAGEASMDGYIDFASCPDDRLRLGWRVAAGERRNRKHRMRRPWRCRCGSGFSGP